MIALWERGVAGHPARKQPAFKSGRVRSFVGRTLAEELAMRASRGGSASKGRAKRTASIIPETRPKFLPVTSHDKNIILPEPYHATNQYLRHVTKMTSSVFSKNNCD